MLYYTVRNVNNANSNSKQKLIQQPRSHFMFRITISVLQQFRLDMGESKQVSNKRDWLVNEYEIMISFRVVSSWEKVNVHIRCLEFVCFVFRACCAGCCLYTIRRSFPRNTMYTKPHTCYTFPIEGFTERARCITNCEVIKLFILRNLFCIFVCETSVKICISI